MDQTTAGFGPGAIVMTTDGEMPVEWLERGDRVITRDRGAQPILWIERWKGVDPAGHALPLPVRLMPECAVGEGTQIEPLRLSPQHRVLLRRPEIALYFGADEAIAQIGDLWSPRHAKDDPDSPLISYHHLVMARHEMIWACGIWAETVSPETSKRLAVPADIKASSEIFDPQTRSVRMCLTKAEARMMQSLQMPEKSVMQLLVA